MNILHNLFDQDNKFNIDVKLGDKKDYTYVLNKLYNYETENRLYDESILDEIKFNKIRNKIDICLTKFGNKYFDYLIRNPLDNIEELKLRQIKILKYKNNDKKISLLIKIRKLQNTILSFWDNDDFIDSMIYFDKEIPLFKKINKNKIIQQIINIYKIYISPLITIVSPLLFFILPIIILKIFSFDMRITKVFNYMFKQLNKITNKINIGNKSPYMKYVSIFMWILFYIQNSYASLMTALNTKKIVNIYYNKLKVINEFIETYNLLTEEQIDKLNIESTTGGIITSYYEFKNNKNYLISMFKKIGEIDCYISINRLCGEGYNMTKYVKSKNPKIKFKKIFHPLVENNIPNSLNLKNNILITGPNRSGKSTFIKSCLLGVILSQTICISNSSEMVITPFNYINCDINISDTENKNSLFEAELDRAINIINKIKKTDKYMLNITDEIFSSTNNKESKALSYGIIKNMIKNKNLLSIITSHNYDLGELSKKNNIKNYCFKSDHKIRRGVSKEYKALEILKEKKIDKEIIKDCYEKFNA